MAGGAVRHKGWLPGLPPIWGMKKGAKRRLLP